MKEAPLHVAIIMDGNGRWARARNRPRAFGHREGVEAVRRAVKAAGDLGVKRLTLFGFSTENWRRPAQEVADLLDLLRRYVDADLEKLHAEGVRIGVIGDRTGLAPDLARIIERAETLTRENDAFFLTIAFSYGGRNEIARAAQKIAEEAAAGSLDPASVDEALYAQYLDTSDTPDPDLIIRTSGEKRISNFLLWQSAYAELVFLDVLWPDFSHEHMAAALDEFHRRERRYGKVAHADAE